MKTRFHAYGNENIYRAAGQWPTVDITLYFSASNVKTAKKEPLLTITIRSGFSNHTFNQKVYVLPSATPCRPKIR